MIKVFIGYGGDKAEEVANDLDAFLKDEELDPWVASPRRHHLTSVTFDFRYEIQKNIRERDIIVFVCHEGTICSAPATEEIKFIFDNGLQNKMIVFSKCDDCIPPILVEKKWHPFHFSPEKAEESFCRLLNEIFRCYIAINPIVQIETEVSGGR